MKMLCRSLAFLTILASGPPSARAIIPFNQAFKDLYVQPNTPFAKQVEDAKCNLCHDGKNRKNRNDYGKAVQLYLKKADFVGAAAKFNPKTEAGKKALADGLEKAGAEKSSDGKKFDALIKAGELPAPVVK